MVYEEIGGDNLDWEFLNTVGFWVIVAVLLWVGAAFGLAFSGNLPEVIDLTESQRQGIVAEQEKLCGREVRDLKKTFDEAIDAFDDGLDRCFEKNRDLIEVIEDNTEAVQDLDNDLNQAIYDFGQDLNKAIYDLNCDGQ